MYMDACSAAFGKEFKSSVCHTKNQLHKESKPE